MDLEPEKIETLLRTAPVPRPPDDLKTRLMRSARELGRTAGEPSVDVRAFRGTASPWRRWLWLLLPTGVAAALASVLLVQNDRIRELRDELQAIETAAAPDGIGAGDPSGDRSSVPGVPDERREIERLRKVLAELENDVALVQRLEAENARLEAALSQARAQLPAELQDVAKAKDRADSIRCVNNMKQMGLAVRIYSSDHDDEFPTDFIAMANELTTPKVLVCPGDTARTPPEVWQGFTSAQSSYEFVSPGPGKFEFEPSRILFRCPIHGNVGLCDGSVHMGVSKEHPDWIVTRNGALYLEASRLKPADSAPSASGAPTSEAGSPGLAPPVSQPGVVTMPPDMARRYGLIPAVTRPGEAGSNQVYEVNVVHDADGNVLSLETTGPLVIEGGAPSSADDGAGSDTETQPQPEPQP